MACWVNIPSNYNYRNCKRLQRQDLTLLGWYILRYTVTLPVPHRSWRNISRTYRQTNDQIIRDRLD